MHTAIIGAGQMGRYYTHNLVKKCGVPPADIIVFDIVPERAQALEAEYGVVVASEFPRGAVAAIVATNTPSHDEVAVKLAKCGVRHILCEKPLAQTASKVAHIRKNVGPSTGVYTALVINFSPTLTHLLQMMQKENLFLLDYWGRWGKNRGLEKEKRPTAGDLEDEAIHPIGFFLALAAAGRVNHRPTISVSAQLGSLPYVNEQSQAQAYERDSSFPLKPNHSTSANLCLSYRNSDKREEVRASIYSSFLLARETRTVGGILGTADGSPRYAFECNFDQKRPEKTSGAVDTLTLVQVRSGERAEHEFASDKLNDLTRAFLEVANGSSRDPRLVSIDEAASLVDIAEAIIQSDRHQNVESFDLL